MVLANCSIVQGFVGHSLLLSPIRATLQLHACHGCCACAWCKTVRVKVRWNITVLGTPGSSLRYVEKLQFVGCSCVLYICCNISGTYPLASQIDGSCPCSSDSTLFSTRGILQLQNTLRL